MKQVGCWLVGLVFVAAGVLKVGNPQTLVEQMRVLELPGQSLFPVVALVLPVAEVVLGLALFLPSWRGAAWLALWPLTVVFTVVLAWAWWRGLDASCGCFGDVLHISTEWALVRNLVILAFGGWWIAENLRSRGVELLIETLQEYHSQNLVNMREERWTEKWTKLEILADLVLAWPELPDAIKDTISVIIRQFVK